MSANQMESASLPTKLCLRCERAQGRSRRKYATYTCRDCSRDVCEHLCFAKTLDGKATCTSCSMKERAK